MKTTHTNQHSSNSLSIVKRQRGFFTVALGLGLATLFGATSAVIVSAKDKGQQAEVISQQPINDEGVKMVSTAHCLQGKNVSGQSGEFCS